MPAVIGEVDPVVVRLDPADHLGGALGRVGVSVQDSAGGQHTGTIGLVGRLPLEVAGAFGPSGPSVQGFGPAIRAS